VNAGPLFRFEQVSGRFLSLQAPLGDYDAVRVVARLPPEQAPSAIVCIASRDGRDLPRNLKGFPCPRILVLAEYPSDVDAWRRLVAYANSEGFDRVVLAQSRRPARFLRQSGLSSLAWFPGLLFPFSDGEVAAARKAEKSPRIVYADLMDSLSSRRTRLAASLFSALGAAFEPRRLGARAALDFFGASLGVFHATAGEEFSPRIFEALASGAVLIADRLDPESGEDALWRHERELLAYRGEQDLVALARRCLEFPKEARGIGDAGARWFDTTLGQSRRQAAFEDLVFNGRCPPAFELPTPSTVVQAGTGLDFENSDPEGTDPVGRQVAAARRQSHEGDPAAAIEAIRDLERRNPRSVEPVLALAEVAFENNRESLAGKMVRRARALDPADARNGFIVSPAVHAALPELRAARLIARGWTAVALNQWELARQLAASAVSVAPDPAEPSFLSGMAGLAGVQGAGAWLAHGHALQELRRAAELRPGWIEYQMAFGLARRQSGIGIEDSLAVFRSVLHLDPDHGAARFCLGEAEVALGEPESAIKTFKEGLDRAPLDLVLKQWIAHAFKRMGLIEEAHAWYVRSAGGNPDSPIPRPPALGNRRRIVFVAQNGHSWPCLASVYEAFASDPAWEAVVVALPWNYRALLSTGRRDEAERIYQFLTERKIPHVRWDEFDLRSQYADLVFLQNPYDSTRPAGWSAADLVRAGHRLCYVPYSIETGTDREETLFQFDMRLHQYAWAIFARSEAHRAVFDDQCTAGGRHVIASGHPKFDLTEGEGAAPPDPALLAFAGGRKLVLWTPHFDVRIDGSRFGSSFSTFGRWWKFLPDEFERRQDMAFVIRPHPSFFAILEERGIFTRAELDAFVARCASAGNIVLHNSPDYFGALAAGDALVSDLSSLLFEFGISGKPVCHLHNPGGPLARLVFDLDVDYVQQHCVAATTEDQIRRFLDRVASGEAHLEPECAREVRRRMGVPEDGSSIGGRIKAALEERLNGSSIQDQALSA
jgi:tetratricopeptide (TPR) repeat protein